MKKRGKFDLGTYESLIKGGKRGSPILPGKAQDSLLVKMAGHVFSRATRREQRRRSSK